MYNEWLNLLINPDMYESTYLQNIIELDAIATSYEASFEQLSHIPAT